MTIEAKSSAFVFPGQGAQKVGMGKELAQSYPIAKHLFEKADELLGFSLSQLCWEGPAEDLNNTVNTQPALMVHSLAAVHVFQEIYPDFQPAFMAGHSMGELSALVAAGALSYEDGLKLVRTRGELMGKAGEVSPGSMAAFLGLDIPTVEKICQQASSDKEVAQIANDNCPGQVVISGSNAAVERAIPMAKEAGAKRALPLAVSIAAHSPLMTHAQDDFNKAVEAAPITTTKVPIIGNVSALPLKSVAEIEADLQAQLTSRVRWTETIQHIMQQGVNTFIELGSGNVLSGLIRRIDREAQRYAIGSPEDFEDLK